jgi:hypothetical protein
VNKARGSWQKRITLNAMLYGTRKALNALNGHLLNAYKYEVLMRSKVNDFAQDYSN